MVPQPFCKCELLEGWVRVSALCSVQSAHGVLIPRPWLDHPYGEEEITLCELDLVTPAQPGVTGPPVGRIKGGTYSLQGSWLEYERCPFRTEVTLSQSQCPITPIDPRRFASSVGAPSSGGKSGRTCGMRCAIAQIGVATTAIPALLQGVNPIHQANKKADPSRTAR